MSLISPEMIVAIDVIATEINIKLIRIVLIVQICLSRKNLMKCPMGWQVTVFCFRLVYIHYISPGLHVPLLACELLFCSHKKI